MLASSGLLVSSAKEREQLSRTEERAEHRYSLWSEISEFSVRRK